VKERSLTSGVIAWLCAGWSVGAVLTAIDIWRFLFLILPSSKLANPPQTSSLIFALLLLGVLAVSLAVAARRTWSPTTVQHETASRWSVAWIMPWALMVGLTELINYPVPYQAHHADKFLILNLGGLLWTLWFLLSPVSLECALSSRPYGWIKIGLVNVAVFVVVGETVVRVADPLLAKSGLFGDKHTPANLKPSSVVRGSIGFANSQGFKDREHAFERTLSAPRVVALGDSFTWGAGVSYDEAFVTLIERRLQTVAPGAEVIKLGVPAWGPNEEFHLLKTYGIRFHPDLVMLNFFIGNDIQNKRVDDFNLQEILVVAGQSYYVHSNGNWVHDTLGPSRWSLYHNLNYLMQVGPVQIQQAGRHQNTSGAGIDLPPVVSRSRYLRGIYESSDIFLKDNTPYFLHHWSRTKATLLTMRDFLRMQGILLLIVLIPVPVQLDSALQDEYLANIGAAREQYDFTKPQRLLRAWCQENGVLVIDLLPVFEAKGDPAPLYFQNDIHWSVTGHELAAESIFPVLKAQLGIVEMEQE